MAVTVLSVMQDVAAHPSNTVLRNDDPDGDSMTWVPLARDVAEASDTPLPLLNVGVLRRALSDRDVSQACGRPIFEAAGMPFCWGTLLPYLLNHQYGCC